MGSTVGDASRLGIMRGDFNQAGLAKLIQQDPILTNADATQLLTNLPKYLEGANVMESPVIKHIYNTTVKPQLDMLNGSALVQINKALGGTTSIHSEANKIFMESVHHRLYAEFSETGEWPKHTRLMQITQEAVEDTNRWLIPRTDISNLGQMMEETRKKKAVVNTPSAPASAASAPPPAKPSNTLPSQEKSQLTPQQSEVLRRRQRQNVPRPNL